MGKKDTYTRPFMANKERFAELINMHIYQGKDFVKPEILKKLRGGYPALASAIGEKVRDILMEQENPRMRYGMELETGIDYGMPECAGRFIRDYGIDNLKVTLAEACGIIGVTPEEFEKAKALS